MRVERDGQLVGDATFTPEYVRMEVNGPGCGVTYEAHTEMILD